MRVAEEIGPVMSKIFLFLFAFRFPVDFTDPDTRKMAAKNSGIQRGRHTKKQNEMSVLVLGLRGWPACAGREERSWRDKDEDV